MSKVEISYAVITGASKGIGKSIAIALARRGFNLLLIARSANELNLLRSEIISKCNVAVEILSLDLAKADAPETLNKWILDNDYQINALVNNAGYGLWGEFEQVPLSDQMDMCRLNMDTVVQLSYRLLPLLKQQKEAYLLNIASTAAYQAVPTLAIYSATKAFILSFTRAIRFELKNSNVSVTCLSPGPVDTGFAHRAGMDAFSKMAEKFNMKPDDVAEIAVKGMLAKKSEIIPGFTNIISVYANRILPKAFIEKMAAGIYKV